MALYSGPSEAGEAAEAAEEEAEEAAEDHSNNAIEIITSDDDGDGDSGSEVGLCRYCRHQDVAGIRILPSSGYRLHYPTHFEP